MRIDLRDEGWKQTGTAIARGRAFLDGQLLDAGAIADRFDAATTDPEPFRAITAIADSLEGFFAVVVTAPSRTYLVADRARSIPLYYATDGRVVSDRGGVVRDAVGEQLDPVAESEFLLTRYVTGPGTVWSGVGAIRPGEVVEVGPDGIRRRRYWEYWPESDGTTGINDPLDGLRSTFETALDRLERVADGRPIVVPLSGGYDSRLIAAGLAARDHEVVAFTFGRSGHPDVETSREVADRLGIRWEFVPYSAVAWREWYHGGACRQYREWAFGGDSLPFLAEWPAVHELVSTGRVPRDALFCPGHTVVTPSERLPPFTDESADPDRSECTPAGPERPSPDDDPIESTVDGLIAYILNRHYSLWEWDDEVFERAARGRIRRGLLGGRSPDVIIDAEIAAAAYERWEWDGRMSRFTNGDLRVYEDAGVEWWLPLWDPAYVDAWRRLPLASRRNKRLHAELAAEYYRKAGAVPPERATVTDRSLTPADRHLALLRHTPVRQFTERGGEWDPPFLAPRSSWHEPGNHPLAWDGAIVPEILERVPASRNFYALRTLEALGRLDFTDSSAAVPMSTTLSLPTSQCDSD